MNRDERGVVCDHHSADDEVVHPVRVEITDRAVEPAIRKARNGLASPKAPVPSPGNTKTASAFNPSAMAMSTLPSSLKSPATARAGSASMG